MNYFKVVIISLVLSLFSTKSFAQNSYIKEHQSIAKELSQKYGIPSSIMLAIAFVETGGGSSKGAKTYNNHFGIVGKNTVTKSRYRSFSSVRESYEAFCKLLSRKAYYTKLKGTTDKTEWINAIASAGYSTQPTEWKRRIHLIIDKYNL